MQPFFVFVLREIILYNVWHPRIGFSPDVNGVRVACYIGCVVLKFVETDKVM